MTHTMLNKIANVLIG